MIFCEALCRSFEPRLVRANKLAATKGEPCQVEKAEAGDQLNPR
jgi:hypothetical protein